ncbi:malto-oligosyltrehalose synthase [Bradyrhizobium sp. GM22.5]
MPPAIPLATYRLQLTADFDFDKAAAVVPYLKALGITHLYTSPVMKARKGSTHGYDTVDHSQFNPELGGEAGFARLSEALTRHDLGLIIDFVPNHVGVHFADNPWWLDVLEWGQASPHAVSFDIDWDQLAFRARGGVLLPILGASYGEALESGDIELRYDPNEGSFSAWYFEHRLPIAPERYGEVLRMIVKDADAAETETGKRLLSLAARYTGLRRPNRKEAPGFKAELREIAGSADIIGRGLGAYRAAKDRPAQTLALHHLLERQHYKLGHWRLASSDINYRRFFDVNGLAGMRVEDPGTFAATHRLVKQLIADGKLQGIRLDHIDGLRDPAQYCQRLRRLVRDAQGTTKPFYTVIEKILCEHERLPHFAGVQGTTGYEWMNAITHVLVDAKGLEAMDETWRQISNRPPRLAPYVKDCQTARAGDAADQRIHGSDAPACAHRQRALLDPRLFRRQPAAGARALCAAFPGIPHLPHDRRADGERSQADRRHHRASAPGMVRRGRRHFRLPARRAHHGPAQAWPSPAQRPAGAPLCAEGAAIHRADDGEVAGGHRLLSIPPAARPKRGRRRSREQGPHHSRFPRHQCRPAPGNGRKG